MKPRCWNEEAIEAARQMRAAYLNDPVLAAPKIREELDRYPFYHCMEILPGIITPGMSWTNEFVKIDSQIASGVDFRGKRVLDVGCRDGAMALYAEANGAAEIYAVDNDPSPGLVNFIIPLLDSKIQPIELNINDLCGEYLDRFDVIICCGLIYHLQSPFWALRQLRDSLNAGGTLILETAILDCFGDFPVAAYLLGSSSPYEPTSPTFFNLAGLRSAMQILGFGPIETSVEFGARTYAAGSHFPEFLKGFPSHAEMTVKRLALTCTLDRTFSHHATRYSYFDGSHRMHSEGRDRYKVRDLSVFDPEHI